MKSALETRELVTLEGGGVMMRGTYHRLPAGCDALSGPVRPLGVVFLNALSTPRASFGDAAVAWADALAARGYPAFRIDLPGLGDTGGETPQELLHFINAGGYTAVAASKMKELVERFQLSGVVLVGHCAGAVTALFAAAQGQECKGLILMDPYFYLVRGMTPRVRLSLVDWASRSSLGHLLSALYDRVRALRVVARRSAPPRNANFALLAGWKQVASTGVPILILKSPGLEAPGTTLKLGQFAYLKHLLVLAGRRARVAITLIENTDHSFANLAGRAAVQKQIASWLLAYFPSGRALLSPANASCSDAHTSAPGATVETAAEAEAMSCC